MNSIKMTVSLCLLCAGFAQAESDSSSLRKQSLSLGLGAGYLAGHGPVFRSWGQNWGIQWTALPYVREHEGLWDYDVNTGLVLVRSIWDSPVQRGDWGPRQSSIYSYMGGIYSADQNEEQSGYYDKATPGVWTEGLVRKHDLRLGLGAGLGVDYQINHLRMCVGFGVLLNHKRSSHTAQEALQETGLKPSAEVQIVYGWKRH